MKTKINLKAISMPTGNEGTTYTSISGYMVFRPIEMVCGENSKNTLCSR